MWDKLRKDHPWIYEAIERGVLALSAAAFILALMTYLRR